MQDAYYGMRAILFLILLAGALLVGAYAISQIAPALEKSSQAVVNIQAAPQLAQVTVTAAQYALDRQREQAGIDAAKARQEIANSQVQAQADAALKSAQGQAAVISAQNGWMPWAIGGVTMLLGLGVIGGTTVYRVRKASQVQLAPYQAERRVADSVMQNGGSVTFLPSGERRYNALPHPQKQIAAPVSSSADSVRVQTAHKICA